MDNNAETTVIEPDVKKTALHPIRPVINPPIAGPAMFPRPTNIRINPTALPLWFAPNASTTSVIEVPCIIAEPTPCNTRLVNSNGRLADIAVVADPSEKIHRPMIIRRFLPIMSANLPIGSSNAASVNRYAINTH